MPRNCDVSSAFLSRIVCGRTGCRMVVHRRSRSAGYPFGFVVLGTPGVALDDLGEDRGVIAGLPRRQHTPDEAWFTVRRQDVGGAPICLGNLHAGFFPDLTDHGGPVGAVHVQRLAGPLPADQDPCLLYTSPSPRD